jgi:radical SAM superfamily enzyme YgiQ (UPF0313 family)
MKINLLCFEDGIVGVGFRKMASFIKSIHGDVHSHFLTPTKHRTFLRLVLGKIGDPGLMEAEVVREVAEHLAKADILGISSMTSGSVMSKEILKEVKRINPRIFTIWGGIHPIIDPEDAIQHADAICTGEGEFAFEEFLNAFKQGKDFYQTKNFWFNKNGEVVRNTFLPLATGEEMDKFPLPLYQDGELIYERGKGFVPLTQWDYLTYNGLAFTTVWTIGCPYHCSYCGNTNFIENDKNYRKLRHTSVDYLIRQMKDVLAKHPHISTVTFFDDSFMAIPKSTLSEFSEKWKKEINLPFCVQGVIPSFVKEDKFAVLVEAGMNRIRMGIQSGSDRILEFYERPNKPGLIPHATGIIAKFTDYMIPPSYDIIVDNPIETREDVHDTLKLLYNLPRPFTLNIFSLRIIPNSKMEQQFKELNETTIAITSNYLWNAPTLANSAMYLLAVIKPPQWLFEMLLKRAKPFREEQPLYPSLMVLARALWFVHRGLYHIKFMDFPLMLGKFGWVLWKLKLIQVWQKYINKRFYYKPAILKVSMQKSG